MSYNTVEKENTMRALQERDPLVSMEKMVENFKNYVETYKAHDSQAPEVFINDMLYGIGKSMSTEYEFAVGFSKFKGRVKEMIDEEFGLRNKTVLKANGETYVGADGYTMKREYGYLDGGYKLSGEWVLRDPAKNYVDHDDYRNDLAERNHIVLA